MGFVKIAAVGTLLIISGCGTVAPLPKAPPPSALRTYDGSASVGDFLIMTLDAERKTLTFANLSNGDTGTVPYTVNADGSYTLDDPSGNLVAAYEIPGSNLIVQAKKVGGNHHTTALVTAFATTPISATNKAGKTFNYMELRTSDGGFEIGALSMDSSGNITQSSYWPFGTYYKSQSYHEGMSPAANMQQDSSGDFLMVTSLSGKLSYVFGPDGEFVADEPNGTMIGFTQATSKEFDPALFGSYKTSVYQKSDVSYQPTNTVRSEAIDGESGAASFDSGSATISPVGLVIIKDSQNNIVAQGTLQPVADVPYLYNPADQMFSLQDPCYGLFTFRVTTASTQQDVFVSFQGQSAIFSSFKVKLPQDPTNTYEYSYGLVFREQPTQ